MSGAAIYDEVYSLESIIKEELMKASTLLREQFEQEMVMERESRQNAVAELWQTLKLSQQNVIAQAAQLEQNGNKEAPADSEQFSLKMFAMGTAISELKHSMNGQAAVVEQVRRQSDMQAVVQQDIVQKQAATRDLRLEVGLHGEQLQELRRVFNDCRTQLADQGARFSSVAAEIKDLRLKLAGAEAALDDARPLRNPKIEAVDLGALPTVPSGDVSTITEDPSMQNEVHHHFVGLKEALAQLRTDFAVQSKMHQDIAMQQAELQSLREEIAKLKQGGAPATPVRGQSKEDLQESRKTDVSLGLPEKSLPTVLAPLMQQMQQRDNSPIRSPIRERVPMQGPQIDSTPSFQYRMSAQRQHSLPFSFQSSSYTAPRATSVQLERQLSCNATMGQAASEQNSSSAPPAQQPPTSSMNHSSSEGAFSVQSGCTVVQKDRQPVERFVSGGSQRVPPPPSAMPPRTGGSQKLPVGSSGMSNGVNGHTPTPRMGHGVNGHQSPPLVVPPMIAIRGSSPQKTRGSGNQSSKMLLVQQAVSGTQSPFAIARGVSKTTIQM